MATLTIELPPHAEQTAFNLERWAELVEDPELDRFVGRIETDRHGNIVMSPPAAPLHARFQSKIMSLLQSLLPSGEALADCPVSTSDGVKAPDVLWASQESLRNLGDASCFSSAPEICIEILSPRNSKTEMIENRNLYFDAGAQEVWICDRSGIMTFYTPGDAIQEASLLCPEFPTRLELPAF